MKQNRALLLIAVWLMVMVGVVASTVTLLASGDSFVGKRWVSRDEYEMIERYARMEEVRKVLLDHFYLPIEEETLMNGALKGMMAAVRDDYTFYYTPEEMAAQNERTEGEYMGLGLLMQNNSDGLLEAVRVYKDGPADVAGIRTGDLIVAVDGMAVSGRNAEAYKTAVEILKGENGGIVTLGIIRDGASMEIDVVRGDVSINNVSSSVIDGDVGYIAIFQFAGNAVEGFEQALDELMEAGVEHLVIDLRNNPGGNLDDVVEIADRLLGEGLIVYTQDREGRRRDFYSDSERCELPLVVLINGRSASASEILAAAVQDHDRGLIIGQQSFGKGVVQTLMVFESDGAGLQYTSECYYTPKGKDNHGVGVTPDITVEPIEGFSNYSGIPDMKNDVALKKAIEMLRTE